MGRIPCGVVPAVDIIREEQEIYKRGGRKQIAAKPERVWSDVFDIHSGCDRLDNLSLREHWAGVGVYMRNL